MNTLILHRLGENNFGNIVYQDKKGKYYLDINQSQKSEPDELYYCSPSNDVDGEPSYPLKCKFKIDNPYNESEIKQKKYEFQYMMLSRLQDDVEGFVGHGDYEQDKWDCRYHNEKDIWGDSIKSHFEEMKRLWNIIPEDIKPEWCTKEMMEEYELKIEDYGKIYSRQNV